MANCSDCTKARKDISVTRRMLTDLRDSKASDHVIKCAWDTLNELRDRLFAHLKSSDECATLALEGFIGTIGRRN